MTIHAAKGLEFPIVALANLGGRPANRRRAGSRPQRPSVCTSASRTATDEFKTPGFDARGRARRSRRLPKTSGFSTSRPPERATISSSLSPRAPSKPGPMLFDLLPSLPAVELRSTRAAWSTAATSSTGMRCPRCPTTSHLPPERAAAGEVDQAIEERDGGRKTAQRRSRSAG